MTTPILIPRHRPGPRPLPENTKTSVRVLGHEQVEDFRALCHLLGRRPHQLAADMVLDGIRRARQDPDLGPRITQLRLAVRLHHSGLHVVGGEDRG